MNTEELMIGDLVHIKNNVEPDAYFMHEDMYPGQCVKVEEVLSNGINPDWYEGEINDYLPDDAIDPIPLTEEILKSNGYKYDGDAAMQGKHVTIFYGDKKHGWEVNVDRDDLEPYGKSVTVHIKYVHEFQHVLRMCGIKKKIVVRLQILHSSLFTFHLNDPMFVSGSSRIAAHKLGYDYIGFELNKEYFDKAVRRIDLERRQLTLF